MNLLRNRKLKIPLLLLGAIFSVLAVTLLFLIHPTAHIAGGIACASAGAVLPEAEFQKKIADGVSSLVEGQQKFKSDFQKIVDDFGRTDKEVKQAAEAVQKLMKASNEQELAIKRLGDLQKAVLKNATSSFGDPIKRALADEETHAYFTAIGRAVAAKAAGQHLDDAYKKIIDDGNAKVKSLSGVDTGLGQATVPTETFNAIFDTLLNYGQWSTLGVMRVGMRTTILPVMTSRPQFFWLGAGSSVGEGGTITPGSFGGSSVTLIIQTLGTYITVTRELLQDSTVDLAPYILAQMVQSQAQGLDTAAFIGTGSADQVSAGYYGVFNMGQVNVNCAATSAQGNTMVGATQLDDWVNVTLTVNPQVLTRNPKWWMHPQMVARALLVRDKQGRPLFQTWLERPDAKSLMSILGYPVQLTGIAPNTDGPGQPVAVFGDPEGQAVAIREDLELATSDDIAFPQNMKAFRALIRAGVKSKTLAGSTSLVPMAVFSLSPN